MIDRPQPIKDTASQSSDRNYVSDIWTAKNLAAFGDLARGQSGTSDGMVRAGGFGIVPCTPPGMDPLKDPSNPKASNYDAQTYGPKSDKEIPLIGKDGVIDSSQLLLRQLLKQPQLHLYSPEYLPYGGMCKDLAPDPGDDPSQFPSS